MRHKKSMLFTITILILQSSCIPNNTELKVANEGNFSIYVTWEYDTTKIIETLDSFDYYSVRQILPRDTGIIIRAGREDVWKEFVAPSSINNKINLFVYPIDTLFKYRNISGINKRLWINRFSYSISELDSMNWIIEYHGCAGK